MALIVGVPREETILLGAFQRRAELASAGAPVRRRTSGGAAARVGPGTVFVQLAAEGIAGDKVLNRQVRPLLRALTKVAGRAVNYFGRDWIACAGQPVGMVAFAHEAATGRSTFEAFVSARSLVWLGERASHRGKTSTTLDVDPARAAEAIAAAYGGEIAASELPTSEADDDPPWAATREEAIGLLAAGRDARGRMRLGGELMASTDAVARFEELLADANADVDAAVEQAFGAPGVVTFGVRDRASIAAVVRAARQGERS